MTALATLLANFKKKKTAKTRLAKIKQLISGGKSVKARTTRKKSLSSLQNGKIFYQKKSYYKNTGTGRYVKSGCDNVRRTTNPGSQFVPIASNSFQTFEVRAKPGYVAVCGWAAANTVANYSYFSTRSTTKIKTQRKWLLSKGFATQAIYDEMGVNHIDDAKYSLLPPPMEVVTMAA